MGRAQETFFKKEVRNKKAKKKKDKEAKRLAKKEQGKSSMDDMMAYVDENGMITDTPPDPNIKKKVIKAENIEISIPKSEAISITDSVRKGTVSFYNDSKGFGFIVDSETKESIFMHVNNIEGEIKENNVVSFEVEMGPKGPNAINVKQAK